MKQYFKKCLGALGILGVMIALAGQYRWRADLPVNALWLAKSAIAAVVAALLAVALLRQLGNERPRFRIPIVIAAGAGFLVTALEFKRVLFEPVHTVDPYELGFRLVLALGAGVVVALVAFVIRKLTGA